MGVWQGVGVIRNTRNFQYLVRLSNDK